MISDADAVVFGAQIWHLAGAMLYFGSLGYVPFWRLGDTVEGHGSSREDTLGYGFGILPILGGSWEPILRIG